MKELRSLGLYQDERISLIRTLVEEKKYSQALAEIKETENSKRIPQESLGKGAFLYLSAVVLYHTGRYKEAQDKAILAYEIYKSTAANQTLGDIQYILGAICQALGDFDGAETQLRDAVAAFRRVDDHEGMAQCLNKLANLFFIRSDYLTSSEYLKQALRQVEKTGDQRRKAGILGNLGRVYTLLGQLSIASENLKLNLKANQKFGDQVNLARSWLALGFVEILERQIETARQSLQNAQELIVANNLPREMAIFHEYMGQLCVVEKDYLKAEEHYKKSLEIGEEIAPEGDIINQVYRLWAELKALTGNHTAAAKYARRSLETSLRLGDRLEEAAAYRVLAVTYDAGNEATRAKKQLFAALKIQQKIKNDFELAQTYLTAGKLKSLDGLTALKFLSKAEDLFAELGTQAYLAATYLSFAELLGNEEEQRKALVFMEEAEKLSAGLQDNQLKGDLDRLKLKAEADARQLTNQENSNYTLENVITVNPQLKKALELADRFKDSDIAVFLEGQTGTGKDLMAKAIHYSGRRREKKFIAVNCSAIPEALLENQLFGYARGAFTGADKDKPGLLEIADGGTFYLDEIADAPLSIQVKLLRVLETKELTRLGDNESRKIDVRFIASTNRDLNKTMEEGRLRTDLYYRLCGVRLVLPPLKERKEDIPLLVDYFLKQAGPLVENVLTEAEKTELYAKFQSYDWPGSVRELENEIKRSVVLAGIKEKNLLELMRERFEGLTNGAGNASLAEKVEDYEKGLILQALRATNWVKTRAAKMLNIPESTLRHKIDTYQLTPESI
ncbi:MAG: sigma 54-interacting transcriptional regulator [candidate division Zixibacteria bacterium]|nr:sigma 54-interacting transcriptional regulator [candidate division Zixibacteria bacterium]